MCKSMADIPSTAAEIRRGKKEEEDRRKETTGQKYNGPLLHRAAITRELLRRSFTPHSTHTLTWKTAATYHIVVRCSDCLARHTVTVSPRPVRPEPAKHALPYAPTVYYGLSTDCARSFFGSTGPWHAGPLFFRLHSVAFPIIDAAPRASRAAADLIISAAHESLGVRLLLARTPIMSIFTF